MKDANEFQERTQRLNDITQAETVLHAGINVEIKTIQQIHQLHSFFIKRNAFFNLSEKSVAKFTPYLDNVKNCEQAINNALQEIKQWQLDEERLYQQSPDMTNDYAISRVNIERLRQFSKDMKELATLVGKAKSSIKQQAAMAKGYIQTLHALLEQAVIEETNSLYKKATAYKTKITESIKTYGIYEENLKNSKESDFLSQFIEKQTQALTRYQQQTEPLRLKLSSALEAFNKYMQPYPFAISSGNEKSMKASWAKARSLFEKIENIYIEAENNFTKITSSYTQYLKKLNPFPNFEANSRMKRLIERIIRHWERNPSNELGKLVSFITGKEVARLPDTNEHDQFLALQTFMENLMLGEELSFLNPKQRTISEQVWFDSLSKYINAVITSRYEDKGKHEKFYFVYADLLFYPEEVNLTGYDLSNIIMRLEMLKKILCIWSVAANKLHRLIQANLQLELYQSIHSIFAENYKLILEARNIKSYTLEENRKLLLREEAKQQKLNFEINELAKAIADEKSAKTACEIKFNEYGGNTKLKELEKELHNLWQMVTLSEAEIQRQDDIQNILGEMKPLHLEIKRRTGSLEAKEKEMAEKMELFTQNESTTNDIASKVQKLVDEMIRLDESLNFFEALKNPNHAQEERYPTHFVSGPELPEFLPARKILSQVHSISLSPLFFGLRDKENMALEGAIHKISQPPQ